MNARAAALLITLTGCVENAPADLPTLDSVAFTERVQPILAERCASPACHGSERRRLRVYAPGYFRRDPTRVHRDEALSAGVLAANERSAAAFASDVTAASESLLVTKPLGRVNHLGGRVFTEADEAQWTLLAWLRSGGLP